MSKENKKDLLRLITAGSVDDGKSTLIGRLLYDTKSIFEDQLESVSVASTKKGNEQIDLSMFTDGLRDERALGITIDVAYKYFSTANRKFILADTPGHYEFTRNMITGASTSSLVLLLIDARNGIVEQTKRHAYLSSLIRLPNILVCINKMDLVGYDQKVYDAIVEQFNDFSSAFSTNNVTFIPISALKGDNVVKRSSSMPWYTGAALLATLETIPNRVTESNSPVRMPVQLSINDPINSEIRIAGRLASGTLRVGDEISILPSRKSSKIKAIYLHGEKLNAAHSPMSIAISLNDKLDVKRGCIISALENSAQACKELDLMLCWLMDQPLEINKDYLIKYGTSNVTGKISSVEYKIDVNNAKKIYKQRNISMNDIARVQLSLSEELIVDKYQDNKTTGSLIVIDIDNCKTLAAGMIL
ncbi:GTP-binding protein [Saprospiraceae bacterium]|nr:GTP-binding protein [Saprospiraceae bacterium]